MTAVVNKVWYFLVGPPLLLLIGLSGLYDHLTERSHRNDALARGTEAQARVAGKSGIESVLVEWTDADGRKNIADSWVGKPFARRSVGETVAIKYLPGSRGAVVILSEAAERERVNAWWINANFAVVGTMSVVCAVFGIMIMRGRRSGRKSRHNLSSGRDNFR
jgi:hypothetical protein